VKWAIWPRADSACDQRVRGADEGFVPRHSVPLGRRSRCCSRGPVCREAVPPPGRGGAGPAAWTEGKAGPRLAHTNDDGRRRHASREQQNTAADHKHPRLAEPTEPLESPRPLTSRPTHHLPLPPSFHNLPSASLEPRTPPAPPPSSTRPCSSAAQIRLPPPRLGPTAPTWLTHQVYLAGRGRGVRREAADPPSSQSPGGKRDE
jgi:hypothetical protein